ncbi:MAG: proline dehydrogenase [Gemmatimonadales bacterium]|nr:MAG: proline dehydrogenase [Gemmatimonadales bacterium]
MRSNARRPLPDYDEEVYHWVFRVAAIEEFRPLPVADARTGTHIRVEPARSHLMGLGRSLLLTAAASDRLNRMATRSRVVRRATRAFMPGETVEAALEAGRGLVDADGRGLLFTHLGEALTTLVEAERVRDHYLGLLDRMAAAGVPGEISVKPTQLGLEQSPRRCAELAGELADRAHAVGSVLWLDMEDSSYVDRTLDLYESLKVDYPRTGLALQAYLRRTPADLERLAPLGPVVRLVKGAYSEPPEVAFPRKADTDRTFQDVALRMMELAAKGRRGEGPPSRAVLGTHDLLLVGRIQAEARERGLPPNTFEVHMLYGIRANHQARLRSEGQAVSTLISYGQDWYRWYMRRLAERPANVWFVARSIFG